MKNTVKIFGAVAGMASLLVSCQHKEIVDNTPAAETVEISITAEVEPGTKTYLDGSIVKWGEGEKLSVIEVATTTKGRTSLTKNDSSDGVIDAAGKISFPIKFNGLANLTKVYYYSIYPNTALYSYESDDNNNLKAITVNLDPEQKPTATSFGPKADLLVARPKCFAAQTSNIAFNFARVIAVGKMKIKDLPYPADYPQFANEPIYKVTITTDGDKISGKSTFGFKGISIDVPEEFGDSNEIILDYDEEDPLDYKTGKSAYAYFTAWPGEVNGTLTIAVETEHFIFTREVSLAKALVFKTAEFTSFQVSFADNEKNNVTVSVKDFDNVLPEYEATKYYTIGNGSSVLSAENGSLALTGASAEVEQSSAWTIEFNEKKNTYRISSLYPVKYVKAVETSLQLTDSAEEATEFSITQEGEKYFISKGSNYVSVDNGAVSFSGDKKDVQIQPATVKHTINAQSSLILPAAADKVEIPVTFFGFDELSCESNVGWITGFEAKDGILSFNVAENDKYSRDGKITLSDGNNLTKDITVIQRANSGTLLYATLDITDDLLQYFSNGWVTDVPFTYTQDNSASWEILCGASKVCMEMSKPAEYYVKLPELAVRIKSIKVVTTMGTKLIFENNSGEKKEAEINSNGTNEVETVVTFGTDDIQPSVLKVASKTKIIRIVIDAREPLKTPAITVPADGSKTLTWSNVSGADSYDVTVGDTKVNTTEISYTFDGDDEYYNVSVVAIAAENSLTNISSATATATDVKFGKPTLKDPVLREGVVTENSITVVWDKVANAEKYICKLGDTEKKVSTNEVTFDDLGTDKDYTITVQAEATSRYAGSSEKTITVKTLNKTLVHVGSLKDPYPVDEAKYLIDRNADLTGKYVTGKVKEFEANGDKMTYIITDGTDLEITDGNDLGDKGFANGVELPLNTDVVVYYKEKVNGTYNTYLYSIGGKTSILAGIEVADEKTTEYYYGDKFVKPAVYALYRGKDKEEINDGLLFTIGNNTIGTDGLGTYGTGSQTVLVSYNGKTTNYGITVENYYLHKFDGLNTMIGSGGKGKTWTNVSGGITTTLYDCLNDSGRWLYAQTGNSKNIAFESTITTDLIAQTIKSVTIKIDNVNANNTLLIEGELLVSDNKDFTDPKTIVFKQYNSQVVTGGVITLSKPEVMINLKDVKGENLYYRLKIDSDANNYYKISQIIFNVE